MTHERGGNNNWAKKWPLASHLQSDSESSIQRSGQTVFIVSLKLPSFTIWDPVIESSISYSLWTKVQWKCVHCSSCVQVHLHPFKPLRTNGGANIQTSK